MINQKGLNIVSNKIQNLTAKTSLNEVDCSALLSLMKSHLMKHSQLILPLTEED